MAQAYVFPLFTFDFSVIYEWETWFKLLFINTGMTVLNYLWIGRFNKDKFQKKKPQHPEVKRVISNFNKTFQASEFSLEAVDKYDLVESLMLSIGMWITPKANGYQIP